MRNVLVGTDFSDAGNAAIGLAFALAEPGGTVHLVHVVPLTHDAPLTPHDILGLEREASADPRRTEIHKKLAALLPANGRERTVRTYAHSSRMIPPLPSHKLPCGWRPMPFVSAAGANRALRKRW